MGVGKATQSEAPPMATMKVAKKAIMATTKGMTCAGMMMISFEMRMIATEDLRLDQDQNVRPAAVDQNTRSKAVASDARTRAAAASASGMVRTRFSWSHP